MKFNTEDRIAVYGKYSGIGENYTESGHGNGRKARIVDLNDCRALNGYMIIQFDDANSSENKFYCVHPKQCRRLIKKKRLTAWLNKNWFRPDYDGKKHGCAIGKLYEKPTDLEARNGDWAEFVEVKK